MSFSDVLSDMAAASLGEIKEGAGEIGTFIRESLEEKEASLKELYDAFRGELIDEAGLVRELNRELKVMEVKLLTVRTIKKATAQRAVNAAVDVFRASVKAVL
ncbi:MAG: hypothetical protein WD266_03190 [Balneolales bacterium]